MTATLLLATGVEIHNVQDLLGNRNGTTMQIYEK
jgi:site-specific recombinase XerD